MIKLSQASFDETEIINLRCVLDECYLGMGKYVSNFEQDLKLYLGNDMIEVACVNSGTAALHLALQAIDVKEGDEVIVPSVTFAACFQAVTATGAKPVASDIDINTGLLDIDDTKKRINNKTKAIMYVHYAGNMGDVSRIFNLANSFNLRVIEDAAHSLGGTYQNKKIGTYGDITCFSFDSIKNITCGEGGAVVSSDNNIINKVRDIRLLGIENDTKARFKNNRSWDFDIKEQGWRYHMSNLNAAIGIAQLKKIETFIRTRQKFAHMYHQTIKSNYPIMFFPLFQSNIAPHIFPIRVLNQSRDKLKEYLNSEGIETGFHYKPNHLLSKFKNENLPNAELFWNQILTLPLHCNLTDKDIDYISNRINNFFEISVNS